MIWDVDTRSELLLRLLERYGEQQYTIRRKVELCGTTLPALAQFHLKEERHIFGIKSDKLKAKASEANEYVMFTVEDAFLESDVERAIALCEEAEKEFLNVHDEHGHSFFSLVVLAGKVEPAAARKLKRYRRFADYEYGWGMVRVAVWDATTGAIHCNRDGKDLARLIRIRLGE